jgi:hypothetical protein
MRSRFLALAVGLGLTVVVSTPATVASQQSSPIERALGFLLLNQLRQPLDVVVGGARIRDFPGNWPQFYSLRGSDSFRVRDVSPFMVAFVHHALTEIVEEHRIALGLSAIDLAAARSMRRRAVAFVKAFESPANQPDAGTFAFWPYDAYPDTPDPARCC